MCKWHGSDLIAIETKQEQDWFVSQALTFNRKYDSECSTLVANWLTL